MAKTKTKKLHKKKIKKTWLTKWKIAIIGFLIVVLALFISTLKQDHNILGVTSTASSCKAAGGTCRGSGFCNNSSANGYTNIGNKNCGTGKLCCVLSRPTPVKEGPLEVNVVNSSGTSYYPPPGISIKIFPGKKSDSEGRPIGTIDSNAKSWGGEVANSTASVVIYNNDPNYSISAGSCYNSGCKPSYYSSLSGTKATYFQAIDTKKNPYVFIKIKPKNTKPNIPIK